MFTPLAAMLDCQKAEARAARYYAQLCAIDDDDARDGAFIARHAREQRVALCARRVVYYYCNQNGANRLYRSK